MKIFGVKADSLIEWKNHISFVIFVGGCNFRCPFCYVPQLVTPENYALSEIPVSKVLEEIEDRKNFIDGVCITGGEPLLNPEIENFLEKIKSLNLKIKIETNGSNPEFLEKLLSKNLIDALSLDIKNSKGKYSQTINTSFNLSLIDKTLELLSQSSKKIEIECRTTLVPSLHELEDIKKIAEWLISKNIESLTLQQFRADLPHQSTLNPDFIKKGNFPEEKMFLIKEELEKIGPLKINLRI